MSTNKIFFSIALVFLITSISFSKSFQISTERYDDEPEFVLPESAKKFIPAQYVLLNGAKGSLNENGFEDVVLILRHESEDSETDDVDAIPDRQLIVLFNDGENNFTQAVSKEGVILCKWCGGVFGDPFFEVKISDEVLSVSHYGGSAWRWGFTHEYKLIDGEFHLIAESGSSYHNISWCDELDNFENFSSNSYNYLTGDYEEFEIADCVVIKNEKGNKKPEKLIKLTEYELNW